MGTLERQDPVGHVRRPEPQDGRWTGTGDDHPVAVGAEDCHHIELDRQRLIRFVDGRPRLGGPDSPRIESSMTGIQKDRLAPVAVRRWIGDAGSAGEQGGVHRLAPGRATQVDSGQGSRTDDGNPCRRHQHDEHYQQSRPPSGAASPGTRHGRRTLRSLHADGSFMIRCDRAPRLSVGMSCAVRRNPRNVAGALGMVAKSGVN